MARMERSEGNFLEFSPLSLMSSGLANRWLPSLLLYPLSRVASPVSINGWENGGSERVSDFSKVR